MCGSEPLTTVLQRGRWILSSRSVWTIEWVPRQSWLHRETLFQKIKLSQDFKKIKENELNKIANRQCFKYWWWLRKQCILCWSMSSWSLGLYSSENFLLNTSDAKTSVIFLYKIIITKDASLHSLKITEILSCLGFLVFRSFLIFFEYSRY